jgi:hypothetical protein
MQTTMTPFGGFIRTLVAEAHWKAVTGGLMFLIPMMWASLTWAQPQNLPQTAPEPVMVAQAPAERGTCINPKTGLPDHLVQCFVSPCLAFEPSSPFATCADNYCGGCHAILCGVLLEDVADGLLSTQ